LSPKAPLPLSDYIATSPEGLTTQFAGVTAFVFPLPFFLFFPQVPPPLSDYIATSPEGLTAQLAGVTAFVYYLTTPPNVLGGMFKKKGWNVF